MRGRILPRSVHLTFRRLVDGKLQAQTPTDLAGLPETSVRFPTLDDGTFSARPWQWGNNGINAVASRHQRHATAKQKSSSLQPNQDAMGNGSFCDGHAEFFSRVDALRRKYSGNCYPDPNFLPFAR